MTIKVRDGEGTLVHTLTVEQAMIDAALDIYHAVVGLVAEWAARRGLTTDDIRWEVA